MRRVLFVTAAVAAVIFFALATLPPRPQAVDASGIDPDLVRRTVRGAYHIHTTRSDGASDKPAIAAAAARAGLKFAIFTDHGDGTLPSEPPAYLSGVLCIDGVEISTNGGHYVALGMQPSPYPLGGEPSAVVEDVQRLGGFGIAAHPDSAKPSLAWHDWDAPIDGIEWLSADSEWRDESSTTLVRTFFYYLLRPGPALALLMDRPVTTLKRWDELTRRRPVVALAAHDAHGGIGRGMEEGGSRKRALGHVPSYEASFRTFSDSVILDAQLTGDARADSARVLDAIRHGRVFTVIDAIATPGYVELRGSHGSLASEPNMGAVVSSGSSSIRVNVAEPSGSELVAMTQGATLNTTNRAEFATSLEGFTGAFRVEVHVPGAPGIPPVPWLVTNPVYFLPASSPSASVLPRDTLALATDVRWHVEKDPRSQGGITLSNDARSLQYSIAPGARASQFVAMAVDLKGGLPGSQIVFSASAVRPSRVSVQLRYARRGGERWGSSVHLGPTPREMVVSIDRMRPLDRQSGPAPDPGSASSLLFVVDLTNAKPGDANTFTVADLRVAR
jgi:hypothetical protein